MKKSTIIWIIVLVTTNGLWFGYSTLLSQNGMAIKEMADDALRSREDCIRSIEDVKAAMLQMEHQRHQDSIRAELD